MWFLYFFLISICHHRMLSQTLTTISSSLAKSTTLDSFRDRLEVLRWSYFQLLFCSNRSELINDIKLHLGNIPTSIKRTSLSLRRGRIIVQKFVGALLVPGRLWHSNDSLVELLAPHKFLFVKCALHLKGLVCFDVTNWDWLGWEGLFVSWTSRSYWTLVTNGEYKIFSDKGCIINMLFVNTIWDMIDICW